LTFDDDNAEATESEGGMAEHLQRYKHYLENLKQGKSSGISSVFGRATDLLPPEVMEIRPPLVQQERQAVNPRGVKPSTSDSSSIEDDEDVESDDDSEFDEETVSDDESDEHESDVDVSDDDGEALDDETEDDDDLDSDDEDSAEDYESDEANTTDLDGDHGLEYTNELTVTNSNGAVLWKILFNRAEPVLVSMSDGTTIRMAEGRDDSVLALRSGNSLKFFILSGYVIDPSTGNIYVEANDGAYTAAFLNNGWQIHQYRTHDGEETYYATEPHKPGRTRATMQITNLGLDPATGEVSYDSLDGSASMTLKSRRI